jgi:hypothetical protein
MYKNINNILEQKEQKKREIIYNVDLVIRDLYGSKMGGRKARFDVYLRKIRTKRSIRYDQTNIVPDFHKEAIQLAQYYKISKKVSAYIQQTDD